MVKTKPPLTPEELVAKLSKDEWAPVYLLAGPDQHRIERTARWMRERCVEEAAADFNVESIHADEASPGEIVEKASAYPMFGGKRFVWVRRAEALPSGSAIEVLLRYLERPVESTVLVLTSAKLDKRLKLSNRIAESAGLVEFAQLRGAALFAQLRRQAKSHGLELRDDAAQTLVELVGEDLGELDAELGKLALQDEATTGAVDAELVRELVARSRAIDAFGLADALNASSPLQALDQWFAVRQTGGDLFGTAAILGWKLRQISQLQAALEEGLRPDAAAKAVGLAPWQARRTLELARGTDSVRAANALGAWRRADRTAKSSSLGAGLAYDLAILDWALDSPS